MTSQTMLHSEDRLRSRRCSFESTAGQCAGRADLEEFWKLEDVWEMIFMWEVKFNKTLPRLRLKEAEGRSEKK